MTENELLEIEEHVNDLPENTIDNIPNLISEVRRLRAVIKQAEFIPHVSPGYQANECPWCMGVDTHAHDCLAFTTNGVVK